MLRSAKKRLDSSSLVRALVIDDNAAVRAFVERVLRDAGYETATARDGLAARDYVLQSGAPEVVITDQSMPRMSGHEFVHWLRQQRPDVRVLYLTGDRGTVMDDEVCLEKPCTIRALLHAVATVVSA